MAGVGINQLSLPIELDEFMRLGKLESNLAQSSVFYDYNSENILSSVSNSAWNIEYLFDKELDAGYVITLADNITISMFKNHDPHRRSLVTGITNLIETSVHSGTEYSYNLLGNVTACKNNTFDYNARSEVSDAIIDGNHYNYRLLCVVGKWFGTFFLNLH